MTHELSAADLPPPPRKVGPTPTGRALRKVALYFLLFCSALIAIQCLTDYQHARAFARSAVYVKGAVAAKVYGSSVMRKNPGQGVTLYYLGYKYSWGRQTFSDVAAVPYAQYREFNVGDPFTVYVDPHNPADHNTIKYNSQTGAEHVLGILVSSCCFLLFFAIGYMVLLAQEARDKWRLKHWTATDATVRGKAANGENREEVELAYVANGQAIENTLNVSLHEYDGIYTGESVIILYDPRSPLRCVPYDSLSNARIIAE